MGPNNQGVPELPQPHLHHPLHVTNIQNGTVPLHLTSQFSLIYLLYLLNFYFVVLHSCTIHFLLPKAHASLPQPLCPTRTYPSPRSLGLFHSPVPSTAIRLCVSPVSAKHPRGARLMFSGRLRKLPAKRLRQT